MSMKEHNLMRLLDGCCDPIEGDLKEVLFDYFIDDDDLDLNDLNVDDFVINALNYNNRWNSHG